MNVLVTGGGGYLGSSLIPLLLAAGHRVTALDRFYFGKEPLAGPLREHSDQLTLQRADVRGVSTADFDGFDAVVDLAGISNDPTCEIAPELTRGINLEGCARVAAKAAEAGVARFVFASSCSVYGHGQEEALTETSALRPVSLYSKCKAASESSLGELAARTPMSITTLRLATLFGVSGRTRFDLAVNVMTKNAYVSRRITVEGGGRQWRPFLHVNDAARAFALVLERPIAQVTGRVFNTGGDDNNVRIQQLAYRVRDQVPGTEIVMAPTDPELRDYNVSFARIRSELGYLPERSIDDGIAEVLLALREGKIDPDDRRGYTRQQYLFLSEIERTYERLALDGKILS